VVVDVETFKKLNISSCENFFSSWISQFIVIRLVGIMFNVNGENEHNSVFLR
jgi:hypothetical protein